MARILKAMLLLAPVCAFPQAEALTILAVKSALEDALKAFNNTIVTAGNEVRSTGMAISAELTLRAAYRALAWLTPASADGRPSPAIGDPMFTTLRATKRALDPLPHQF